MFYQGFFCIVHQGDFFSMVFFSFCYRLFGMGVGLHSACNVPASTAFSVLQNSLRNIGAGALEVG